MSSDKSKSQKTNTVHLSKNQLLSCDKVELNYFNLLGDPLNLFYIAYSVQYSLLPALLFGIFYKRRNVTSAISSIIAGIIFTLFIGFYFLPKVQQGDMSDYLQLRPDQWLGLLPFLISLISAITYFIINLFNRK